MLCQVSHYFSFQRSDTKNMHNGAVIEYLDKFKFQRLRSRSKDANDANGRY